MTIITDPMEMSSGQLNRSPQLPGEGRSGDLNVGVTSIEMIIKQSE